MDIFKSRYKLLTAILATLLLLCAVSAFLGISLGSINCAYAATDYKAMGKAA